MKYSFYGGNNNFFADIYAKDFFYLKTCFERIKNFHPSRVVAGCYFISIDNVKKVGPTVG
jgi:hypothetical protein